MTLINGVMATLHPDRANGLTESIIAISLIVGIFILVLVEKEIPESVIAFASVAVGFYFGAKGQKNSKAK